MIRWETVDGSHGYARVPRRSVDQDVLDAVLQTLRRELLGEGPTLLESAAGDVGCFALLHRALYMTISRIVSRGAKVALLELTTSSSSSSLHNI